MADEMGNKIKAAKAYKDSLDAINKGLETQKKLVGTLADEMGIAFGAWQSQTKKTQEDRLKETKLLNDARKAVKGTQDDLALSASNAFKLNKAFKETKTTAQMFADAINKADPSVVGDKYKDIYAIQQKIAELEKNKSKISKEETIELEALKGVYDGFYKDSKDFQKENEKHFDTWLNDNKEIQSILNELPLDSIEDKMDLIKKLREGDLDATNQILASDNVSEKNKKSLLGLSEKITNEKEILNDLQIESQNNMKAEMRLSEKLKNVMKENSDNAFKAIWSHMKDTNKAFKEGQREFGLIFDNSNLAQMTELTSEAAKFNMSTKDTVQMMGQLGEELKTTDTKYLANSVKHFTAIEKATGISSGEITTIAGEMMRAGKSAEDVEKSMEGANTTAKLFGVNTKKVLQGVAKNIDKMRTMGFQGGVESLTKMVATAERLRMNVDEIFDVAKKARTIEGAMDMAADLQLAGGSFANIDPMSLLAAARKGPAELTKILTSMGDDIGRFNDDGTFELDAIDADRLQMVADATGQSVDSLSKMIQKNAEDNKKMDFMPDMQLGPVLDEDGKPVDQDMLNNMLLDAVDVNGDALKGGMLDEMGIASLEDLTADQATQMLQKKVNDKKTLEEQAKANQSFSETIEAFKTTIMNLFTVFQPVIEVLNWFIQGLIEAGGPIKWLAAALVAFVAFGPMLLGGFSKLKDGASAITDSFKGFKEKGIKGIFSGATKDTSIPGADSKDMTPKGGKDGGGLAGLSKGLAKMGGKNVLKGIGNTALAGPALALMLLGMPTLLLMAGIGALGTLVEDGFKYTARGISAMGKAKGILKGALAMVIIGAALIPFAFALGMMADVSWKAVVAGLGFLLISAGIIIALGAIMTSGVGAVAILLGAAAMIVIAGAVLVFAVALNTMVPAAEALSSIGFSWLFDLGMALLMASPGLLLGGLALLVATPGLIMGSVGLMAFAQAATLLNEIDWTAFASIGDALLGLVPGLIGFSLAGLMFANPVTLLGMLMMMGNLGMLAAIMVPLSESLNTGADGLDRFAEGLTKLQAAANSLDFDRLESLKDLSMSLAVGSSGGGMGDELAKIAEAIVKISGNAGGGKGGGNRKIEIDLKLNGRQIKEMIIDDTEIVS